MNVTPVDQISRDVAGTKQAGSTEQALLKLTRTKEKMLWASEALDKKAPKRAIHWLEAARQLIYSLVLEYNATNRPLSADLVNQYNAIGVLIRETEPYAGVRYPLEQTESDLKIRYEQIERMLPLLRSKDEYLSRRWEHLVLPDVRYAMAVLQEPKPLKPGEIDLAQFKLRSAMSNMRAVLEQGVEYHSFNDELLHDVSAQINGVKALEEALKPYLTYGVSEWVDTPRSIEDLKAGIELRLIQLSRVMETLE